MKIRLFIMLTVVVVACRPRPITSEIKPVQYCDTIGKYVSANPDQYTTRILNIDLNHNVYTTKKNGTDYYQINVKHIPGVTSYNLRFNDVDFKFKVGEADCELNGEVAYCFVNQNILSEACKEYGYFNTQSAYDCMYRTSWTVSVRPIICDQFYGPFSKPLVGVSLQCNAPEKLK